MTLLENLAQLRSLAGEKGYRLEKALIGTGWYIVDESTGGRAMSDRGTPVFTVDRAVTFLQRPPKLL